jgi:pyruvate/2-oxoglutarate dehydrogenase complex dihydrolipoamide dehydrogenase (E3) component
MGASSKRTYSPGDGSSKGAIEDFDLVILGGGTGSTIAAWTFAGHGQRVAVVERKYIGGSCPNIACLPSKNVLHSAKVASYIRRSEEFGLFSHGLRVEMPVVRARKRAMVTGLNEMYLDHYKRTGAEFICGSGRFVGAKTLEVTLSDGSMRLLRGSNVIISTGTRAALSAIPGLVEAHLPRAASRPSQYSEQGKGGRYRLPTQTASPDMSWEMMCRLGSAPTHSR